ncbi:hypothetical protein E5CHR_05415 [Variovorax sp. PBL-E5]|nr:hypothetical protein SRS16CHR_05466 [Variovorax sp. SRS16]VTU40236.1 hypothetical protein E5CHR_05415 [Variovorax sp. PBL-E5]
MNASWLPIANEAQTPPQVAGSIDRRRNSVL